MPAPTEKAHSTSPLDVLLLALWWALLTGLGEGFLAPTYIWRDLMRAGVEVEPLLFLGVALLVIGLKRGRSFSREDLMQVTFLFSGLAVFACLSRSALALPVLIALLATVPVAALLGLAWLLRGRSLVRWQKRSLPVLLALALWCLFGFPIKQQRHENRDLARLPGAAPGARNVLVIVVDTLRADHLSTYGYSRPTSPHLTKLAAQGALFTNAIAPSSWTLPVHASLLTGLYPDKHHVENDGSLLGWHYRTLGEEFMARGYRTAAFSANTLLFCRRRGFGRGFIHFEDDFQSIGSSFAQTFYGDLIKHLLFTLEWKRDLFGRRSAAQINRHALRWIDSDRRPFFVFLNYLDVHDPYRPPEPYLHRYTKMKDPGSRASEHWDWFQHLTPKQRQGAVDAYDGAISYVDDQIQDLMAQLQRRGLDRNTLVVITSDHGESFGEHGLMTHGNALYRELIHVPLIFWEPGGIPAGKKIDIPVSLTSLPATLLEETGEMRHPEFPQPSLAQLWRGSVPNGGWPDPISELAQLPWNPSFPDYYGAMQSISTARWHFIRGGKFGDELFPCCDEEPEQMNLADTAVGQLLALKFAKELRPLPDTWYAASANPQAPPAMTYKLGFGPAHVNFADFNHDGNVDILVTGASRGQAAVLLGNGRGGFHRLEESRAALSRARLQRITAGQSAPCAQGSALHSCSAASSAAPSYSPPLTAELVDVNADGLQDLLLSPTTGQDSAWLRADDAGRFRLMKSGGRLPNLERHQAVVLARGDIDGNGTQDLAFIDKSHRLVLLIATQPGVFTRAVLSLDQQPVAIGMADVNHNGKSDLVVLNGASDSITVMLSL